MRNTSVSEAKCGKGMYYNGVQCDGKGNFLIPFECNIIFCSYHTVSSTKEATIVDFCNIIVIAHHILIEQLGYRLHPYESTTTDQNYFSLRYRRMCTGDLSRGF